MANNIMNKIKITFVTIFSVLTPVLALAANQKLSDIIDLLINYLNRGLVLLMGLAVVVFVWYVFQYFIKPNENRKEAGAYVMYSLLGFFIILSFWGLVNILQNTFGLPNESNKPSSWTSFSNLFPTGNSNNQQIKNPFGAGNSGNN